MVEPVHGPVGQREMRYIVQEDGSDAMAVEIERCDWLAEQASIDHSWKVLEAIAGSTAVACSHGDVIPELIRRAQLRGMHVPGKAGFAKGSVWTLEHWDGERFATGIYTPIPR